MLKLNSRSSLQLPITQRTLRRLKSLRKGRIQTEEITP